MPDGMKVDYDGLIPNNVGLSEDARVRKALHVSPFMDMQGTW